MKRVMLSVGLVAGLAALMVYAAGCATVAKGTTVTRVDKDGTAVVSEATSDGQYALYGGTDLTPKITVSLKKGDPLGFKRDDTGDIVAVWGSNQQKYAKGTYYWKKLN